MVSKFLGKVYRYVCVHPLPNEYIIKVPANRKEKCQKSSDVTSLLLLVCLVCNTSPLILHMIIHVKLQTQKTNMNNRTNQLTAAEFFKVHITVL